MRAFAVFLLAIISSVALGAPCDGVDRSLNEERKTKLAPVVAQQVAGELNGVKSVEILQWFRYRDWYVIYVDTHVSDEGYLFYHGDPKNNTYLTVLAGAFGVSEEQQVAKELMQGKTKGIPKVLARCIAWQVTKGRGL